MQLNKIMYIDLADPLPKSYAPKKGEKMNRSTCSKMRYRKNYDCKSTLTTVSNGDRTITNLSSADDINGLAGEEQELAKLVVTTGSSSRSKKNRQLEDNLVIEEDPKRTRAFVPRFLSCAPVSF